MRRGLVLLVGAITLCGCSAPGADRYRVPSNSMAPTYAVGDTFSIDTGAYDDAEPRYGDVIVFFAPPGAEEQRCGAPVRPEHLCARAVAGRTSSRFVKRVVGLPGDRIALRDGRAIRNGTPDAFRITPCGAGAFGCDLEGTVTVPPDSYYVLGDNRGASDDSRYWGPVARSSIIGRAD